jgi:hypothetical protein
MERGAWKEGREGSRREDEREEKSKGERDEEREEAVVMISGIN